MNPRFFFSQIFDYTRQELPGRARTLTLYCLGDKICNHPLIHTEFKALFQEKGEFLNVEGCLRVARNLSDF